MVGDVPLFRINWNGDVVKNVVDSITRGSHWANGPYIEDFETRLEDYFGVGHAIVFNSGTTALVSSLEAIGVEAGDEVIVPSFTFISTANAVKLAGGQPVFADIERGAYGLDPDSIKREITDDTVAIVPVHYAGKPCRIEEIVEIAQANDLAVVEDAAEAHGATSNGDPVGTFGDAGMLSFCQNKVVATGEGGAIVTNDQHIAEQVRLFRSHGRASGQYFDSPEGGEYRQLGSNFRMPDIVASVGVAQMDHLEELVERRRSVASQLTSSIEHIPAVVPLSDPANGNHVYQLYTVTFDPEVDRDVVIEQLDARGVASKVYFEPVHLTTYYRREYDYSPGMLPATEDISSRVLSLPMSADLRPEEVDHVANALDSALDAAT